jgi:hypothetical protein
MYEVTAVFNLLRALGRSRYTADYAVPTDKSLASEVGVSIAFSKDVFNKKNTFLNWKNHSE